MIALVLIIIGIAGLMWSSKLAQKSDINPETLVANSHPARTGNILTAEETFYDFGAISMKNGNVSKIFKVSNLSSQDINLESVTTSCMCTTSYIIRENGSKSRPFGMPGHGGTVPKANEIVKAGKSLDIEVVFDPNAHGPAGVGFIERVVFLEDENKNIVEFKFRANVTP